MGQTILKTMLVSALFPMCLGCGSGAKTATVTGKITFEGSPVKAGTIAFVPSDGIPYQGDIQSDGSFRVDNVPVGDVIVVVNPPGVEDPNKHMRIKDPNQAPPPPAAPPPPFPTKYNEIATTDLRYTVKSGENIYNPEMHR